MKTLPRKTFAYIGLLVIILLAINIFFGNLWDPSTFGYIGFGILVIITFFINEKDIKKNKENKF